MRHKSRHLHATLLDVLRTGLTSLGWVTPPTVFDAQPVTIVDYQPDVRRVPIAVNTVAMTIGDVPANTDWEMGARTGGLMAAWYPVFIDVYMEELSLAVAICDDLRDIFDQKVSQVVDHSTGQPDPQVQYEVEEVIGPEDTLANVGAEDFKRNWRIMRLGVRVYYQS